MERKRPKRLFRLFLSIDAKQEADRKQFLSDLCPFDCENDDDNEECGKCNLCDSRVFKREQKILRHLKTAFLKEGAFNIEDIEVLNEKLKELVSPIFTWKYKDEIRELRGDEVDWQDLEEANGLVTKDNVTLHRGFSYGNPLGAIYVSFYKSIPMPRYVLDLRTLTSEKLRRIEPKIMAKRKRLEEKYGLPRIRLQWGANKPEEKQVRDKRHKKIREYLNDGGTVYSAAKLFGHGERHIRRIRGKKG